MAAPIPIKLMSCRSMSEAAAEQDFVEVHDEPRHRYRFKNEHVYVYDVLIPPGDITLYHRHAEDTFYVALGDATVCDHRQGEEPREGAVEKGVAMMMPHREKPLIHQVTNQGSEDMRLIGAVVLSTPGASAAAPLDAPGLSLKWEKPRLRAYDVALAPGDTTGDLVCDFSGLLITISGGCLQIAESGGPSRTLSLAPGDVIWHDGPTHQRFTNVGGAPFEAVLGEWR